MWLWIVFAMLASCQSNNDNDLKILKEHYSYMFTSSRIGIMENSGGNEKVKEILPLLDTIIHYVEIDKKLPQKVKQQMLKHMKENKPEGVSNNYELYDYLQKNKSAFEANNLSQIEAYQYLENFFNFQYWHYWRCNLSFPELKTFVKMDTLYLKPNKTYELQIEILYHEVPSMKILSNSIQGNRPHKIKFTTKPYSSNLQKIPYTCNVMNDITLVKKSFEDTVKYFTIK